MASLYRLSATGDFKKSIFVSLVIIMVLFQVLFTIDSNVSSFSIHISFFFSSELS